MKKWFKAVDSRDFADLSATLTIAYGYPWAGTDICWYYSYGNIRNGVNYTDVYVYDWYGEEDMALNKLGFTILVEEP